MILTKNKVGVMSMSSISDEHSTEVEISESVAAQSLPAIARFPRQEHERVSHPVAPPPANIHEWEAGLRSFASDPHKKSAIDEYFVDLTPAQRRRIDQELRANRCRDDTL